MIEYDIFKNFQKHISLTESEKEQVLSSLILKDIDNKEHILRQGKTCRKIYFVESGSFRAYNLNDDGKESTIMFAIKDWWITDMDCLVNQKPALLSVIALEKSKVIELDFKALNLLYAAIPKFERFFRILFQNAYIREQQRSLQHISLSTEERYRRFVDKYPAIVKKITQKQIASYLGVTPEFLSAIKKTSALKLS